MIDKRRKNHSYSQNRRSRAAAQKEVKWVEVVISISWKIYKLFRLFIVFVWSARRSVFSLIMSNISSSLPTHHPSKAEYLIQQLNVTNAKKVALFMVLGFIVYHGVIHLRYGLYMHCNLVTNHQPTIKKYIQEPILVNGFCQTGDLKATVNGNRTAV